MTTQERFQASRDATAEQRRTGPHREMMQSALARYVAAIGGSASVESLGESGRRDQARWNFENVLVRDVMTGAGVSVRENATFKEIVDTLANRRVSAVPVVDDDDRMVGIVSESDLLAKVVTGGDPNVR